MTPAAGLARQSDILDETLRLTETLARKRERPIWILDIDDTLLSTTRRHLRILREFAQEKGLALADLDHGSVRYSITETAKVAGLEEDRALNELRGYWFERFFKNEYLAEDHPVDGAPQYCRDLLASGAAIYYLTGRDETMRPGTLAALAAHGFPLADPSYLLLKPEFSTPDREFKEKVLSRLSTSGTVAGGFENEPLHVQMLLDIFPRGQMVLVDTRHSGRPAPPLSGVPRIKDYRRNSG